MCVCVCLCPPISKGFSFLEWYRSTMLWCGHCYNTYANFLHLHFFAMQKWIYIWYRRKPGLATNTVMLRKDTMQKNAVILPNFPVGKFCGKAQFLHSFGRCLKLCGNCAFPQNFHTRKLGENYGIFRSDLKNQGYTLI